MSTLLPIFNDLVQQGRGIASSLLGQTYSVYRMNPKTSGSVISKASLVYPAFQMYFDKHQKAAKAHIENTTFDLMVFQGMCDGTKLRVGDIMVENGYASDAGAYCVAQLRPLSPNILIRVESPSTIEKGHPDAGASEEQPTTGAVWNAQKYGGQRPSGRYELTLQGGLYSMQKQGLGTKSSVMIGLQPTRMVKGGHKPVLPTTFPETNFLCYIPPTPGYQINELDIIKAGQADSYSASMIYTSNGSGIQGTICMLSKINT